MNKTDLIEVVAKAADLKKKDAEAAVSAVLDAVADALVKGEKVQLIGFGTFEVKGKAARDGKDRIRMFSKPDDCREDFEI